MQIGLHQSYIWCNFEDTLEKNSSKTFLPYLSLSSNVTSVHDYIAKRKHYYTFIVYYWVGIMVQFFELHFFLESKICHSLNKFFCFFVLTLCHITCFCCQKNTWIYQSQLSSNNLNIFPYGEKKRILKMYYKHLETEN